MVRLSLDVATDVTRDSDSLRRPVSHYVSFYTTPCDGGAERHSQHGCLVGLEVVYIL